MSRSPIPLFFVCLFVLLSIPAAAQISLPGDATSAAAAGNQSTAQIASSGNGYMVVWADTRTTLITPFLGLSGPYTGPGLGTMTDLYAARLDATGALLDTVPIVITEAMYNQTNPLVGWNGQNYLVVWMTQRASDRSYFDVLAARVTPDGVVLDNPPLLLKAGATSNDDYNPWSISSDGTNWAVVYRSLDTSTGIFTVDGLRVGPDGTILDPGGKRLREDYWNSGATNAGLAFASDEYLLVWLEWDLGAGDWLVKGQRLSIALDLVGPVFAVDTLSVTSAQTASVASDGTNFLVTWFENRYFGLAQLYGTRVNHNGGVLDTGGIQIVGSGGYTQFDPDVTWDGGNYLVSYNLEKSGFNEDIYVTRVSANGSVLDSSGILVRAGAANQNQPAMAPAPAGGAHVVWTDLQAGGPSPQDIGKAFVGANGSVGTFSTVSRGAPSQHSPRMAAGAGEFLAVFTSEISGESRILAQRTDASGTALDAEPIKLAAGTPTAMNPAVAFNGSLFLAVWEDSGNVYGRRVRPDGTVLDSAPLVIMAGNRPDVAALGDTFLVVADNAPVDPNYRFVFATRVASSGAVSAPAQLSNNFALSARVAMLGTRWLVVWEIHPTHDNATSVIQGAFVNPDGTPWGAFVVSSGTYDETPALASSDSEALIAWADSDIFGRRILSDGTLLDTASGIIISNASGDQFGPAVAWDGSEFVLDWLDQRNDPYPNQVRGDIYGARVDANGGVLDPGGFAIANSPLPEEEPTVVAGNSTVFFAYAAFQDTTYAAFRIALRQFPFTVSTGCTYALSPSGNSFTANGGSSAFSVLTASGCAWTSASNASWIVLISGASGAGQGTVAYSVLANGTTASRSGTITAAGQLFTVNQAGVPCTYSISPTSQTVAAAGGSGNISVTALQGCAWSANSNANWITINSATSGSGSGTVVFYAAANNSTSPRTGTITVAGQVFTVSQPALLFAVSGRVLASNGKALAKVTITFAIVSGSGPLPASVVTDSNGAYQQTGFQSGVTYSATPNKSPYKFIPASQTFTDGSKPLNFTASK
jgi:BACON domain-containing protein/all-beta uncharacterized protein